MNAFVVRRLARLVTSAVLALPLNAQAQTAGTYRFMICPSSCDSLQQFAIHTVGVLVLLPAPVHTSTFPEDMRRYFRTRRTFTLRRDGQDREEPNACIAWTSVDPRPGARSNYRFVALTHWESALPDSIRVVTFQIPEGSSIATLYRRGQDLYGTARDVGSGAEHSPISQIVARWVGPPALETCFAEARTRRIE